METCPSVSELWRLLPLPTQQYILALSGNHRAAMLNKELCFTDWVWEDIVTWLNNRHRSASQLNKALCAAVAANRMDVCAAIMDMRNPNADPQHPKHSAVKVAARLGRLNHLDMLFTYMRQEPKLYLAHGAVQPRDIYAACEGGHLPVLANLLFRWYVESDGTAFTQESAFAKWLWWSIQNEQLTSVLCLHQLLPHPADGFPSMWETAVEKAIGRESFEIFMWAIDKVYPSGMTSEDVHYYLYRTGQASGNVEITAYLLQQDVIRDKDELHNALIEAAQRHYIDMCWMILQEKNRHPSSHNGSDALSEALRFSAYNVCRLLTSDTAGPARYDDVCPQPWKSPIVVAAETGQDTVLQSLCVGNVITWFPSHPHRNYAIYAARQAKKEGTATFLENMLWQAAALPAGQTDGVDLQPGDVEIVPPVSGLAGVNDGTAVVSLMTCERVDEWRTEVDPSWSWDSVYYQ